MQSTRQPEHTELTAPPIPVQVALVSVLAVWGGVAAARDGGAVSALNMDDETRRDLQAASAVMEAAAYEIDCWFPDDAQPTIQNDLRTVAARLRARFGLAEFVPDDNGGHLQPADSVSNSGEWTSKPSPATRPRWRPQ